jgi:integrative and conjugative element protein (TIGR02256 family)
MATSDRRWRVWISEAVAGHLEAAAATTHPFEAGGILAGVLASGRPWVTHVVEVASAAGPRPSYYEFPPATRAKVIQLLRKSDSRVGYLGEWHSHPTDAGPSSTDIESVRRIGRASDCSRPLLVIVRKAADLYWLDARQWTGRALRPLRVVVAGNLQPIGAPGARKRPRPVSTVRGRGRRD